MNTLIKRLTRTISPSLFRYLQLRNFMLNTLLTDFVQHMNRLTPDHFVIDLGANVGLVSECLAKSGAKVVSFEPNHYVFAELKKWHQDTEISKFETLLLALKTTK